MWTIWFAWTAFASYCKDGKTTGYTHQFLEQVLGPEQKAMATSTSVLLAYILFFIHITRRLNESLRTSIFSHRQVISFAGVIFQYTLSLATVISILANGPSLKAKIDGRKYIS